VQNSGVKKRVDEVLFGIPEEFILPHRILNATTLCCSFIALEDLRKEVMKLLGQNPIGGPRDVGTSKPSVGPQAN
jgi:hypothetical protein